MVANRRTRSERQRGRSHGSTLQNRTFNVAPTWNHLIGFDGGLTAGAFVRRDAYNYYPSGDPFADLGPSNLQQETVSQDRSLTNAGARASMSYVKGIHNVKAGVSVRADISHRERPLRNRGSHTQHAVPRLRSAPGVCRQSALNNPRNAHGLLDEPCLSDSVYGECQFRPAPGLHRPRPATPSPADGCDGRAPLTFSTATRT